MPEIDNSLAASIKPLDVGGALAKAAQLREATANADLAQQRYQHNEREYGENAGLTSGERATMSKTQQEAMGPIGNILSNDQSPQARQQAISLAKRAGIPMDDMTAGHLMTAPPEQVKQYGMNAQRLGQSASSNIEQNPNAIAQRAQGHAGGTELGTMYGPGGGTPAAAAAPSRGVPSPAGGEAPSGAVPAPAAGLSLQERKLEAAGNAGKRVEEFSQYRQENEGAGVQKVALRQLMQDAERVRTGAGADKEQAARKWLMAAGQLIPGLQGVADKYADPVAAFESINKNAGLIARTAIKQVGGTAASELDAISKSLVGTETSQKGIAINASQLVGLETYKQARFQAAQQYQDTNGTLKGFAAEFNKNSGPAAWVYMSLPPEERAKVGESMRKTPEGQRTLTSIAKQLKYIHDNKLDEGVE
jgi:hypothetical protein